MQLPHNAGDKRSPSEFPEHGVNNAVSPTPQANSSQDHDFSEFMWMASEDLEAFDQKVISELDQQLGIHSNPSSIEEEEFLKKMLEEEEERDTVYYNQPSNARNSQNCAVSDLSSKMQHLNVSGSQSNLNPLAAEFVPGQSFQSSNACGEEQRSPLASSSPIHYVQNPLYAHAIPVDAHHMPVDSNGMPGNIIPGQQSFNNVKIGPGNMSANIPLSGHIRPQINGHASTGMNNFYNGMPFYLSNLPVIPVMNGSYVRPPPNPLLQPLHENERCNEDEGYGDN